MLRVAFAALIAAGFVMSGTARATDLYEETPEYLPPILWSGSYVGGHFGGAWGDTDVTDEYDYVGDPIKNSSLGTAGILTGVQIGYNRQSGNFVYGVEADLGYMSLSGSQSTDLPPPDSYKGDDRLGELTGKYSMEGGLYGDLTARVGYGTDSVLFYVKGGAAFLNANFKANYVGANCSTVSGYHCGPANPSTFEFEQSDTLLGWTLGFGVEYALNSNWSLKLEYQHFDFGSTSFDHNGEFDFTNSSCCNPSELKGNVEFSPTVDAVKVGVNYQFRGDDPLR
jgi:outer membrane immunogenic protein